MPGGGFFLDTPGMRELQLAEATGGIEEAFDDVVELFARCRFSDCAHETEPGLRRAGGAPRRTPGVAALEELPEAAARARRRWS